MLPSPLCPTSRAYLGKILREGWRLQCGSWGREFRSLSSRGQSLGVLTPGTAGGGAEGRLWRLDSSLGVGMRCPGCAEITLLLYTVGNLIRNDLRGPASVLLSVVQSQVGEYPVKTDQSHCHWRILDSQVSGNCMRR